ncbi:class I SAM-dependent methyltransferase [Sphingobium yanoikuyae]|uniref:O-methyltransferase n=1 Tax=Sphingobium yanoikuyae TaxID=13690 RepID=UPI002FD8F876
MGSRNRHYETKGRSDGGSLTEIAQPSGSGGYDEAVANSGDLSPCPNGVVLARARALSPRHSERQKIKIVIERAEDGGRWTENAFSRLVKRPLSAPQFTQIAALIKDMSIFAPQQLDALYSQWKSGSMMRSPSEISISGTYGEVLYSIVSDVKPSLIIEAGAGFGVSGSFIASALRNHKSGQLVSFEIGNYWRTAEQNIRSFCDRARVFNGNFEELTRYISSSVSVDMAFIDAIHDPQVIERQVRGILGFMAKNGVIIIDDAFHEGKLTQAVKSLMNDRRISFSASLGTRQVVLVVK